MKQELTFGAPSLTGKDAETEINRLFSDSKFPLEMVVENFAPRDMVFPEVPNLFLKNVSSKTGTKLKVSFEGLDQLHRFGSSVEQISELNHYDVAMLIAEVVDTAPPARLSVKSMVVTEASGVTEGESFHVTVTLDSAPVDENGEMSILMANNAGVVMSALTFDSFITLGANSDTTVIPVGVSSFVVTVPTVDDEALTADRTAKLTMGDKSVDLLILEKEPDSSKSMPSKKVTKPVLNEEGK
jgi:hypothetical protein